MIYKIMTDAEMKIVRPYLSKVNKPNASVEDKRRFWKELRKLYPGATNIDNYSTPRRPCRPWEVTIDETLLKNSGMSKKKKLKKKVVPKKQTKKEVRETGTEESQFSRGHDSKPGPTYGYDRTGWNW